MLEEGLKGCSRHEGGHKYTGTREIALSGRILREPNFNMRRKRATDVYCQALVMAKNQSKSSADYPAYS